MQTIEYLTHYPFARHALFAAALVATATCALSVIVVLKRLAFAGQGMSHAAFGGVGLIVVLGISGLAAEALVLASCIGSALAITWVARLHESTGRRGRDEGGGEDTAIGIVLVGAMALGFAFMSLRQPLMTFDWYRRWMADAPPPIGLESILFGSILTVGIEGVWLSLALVVAVAVILWWHRRGLMFYVFDEGTARAAGVPVGMLRTVLLMLLAAVVAVGMKLVGVVLISALLIVPGATALQCCRRLGATIAVSWAASMIGVVGGVIVSLELSHWKLTTGSCIVLVLVAEFAVAALCVRVGSIRPGGAGRSRTTGV